MHFLAYKKAKRKKETNKKSTKKSLSLQYVNCFTVKDLLQVDLICGITKLTFTSLLCILNLGTALSRADPKGNSCFPQTRDQWGKTLQILNHESSLCGKILDELPKYLSKRTQVRGQHKRSFNQIIKRAKLTLHLWSCIMTWTAAHFIS